MQPSVQQLHINLCPVDSVRILADQCLVVVHAYLNTDHIDTPLSCNARSMNITRIVIILYTNTAVVFYAVMSFCTRGNAGKSVRN